MLIQVILNTLVSAASIALVAVGFSIIYATGRFFNFAHGAVFTSVGYIIYLLGERCVWPWELALPVAVLAASGLGMSMEFCIYCPLRRKGTSGLVLLLTSLGLLIVIQNTIALIFGEGTKTLGAIDVWNDISVGGGRLTVVQGVAILSSAALSAALYATVGFTRLGRMMCAVAEDSDLAKSVGMHCERVILLSTGLGSLSAATGGILVGFDTGLTPSMGFSALLVGVVATVIGGMGSVAGAVWGSLLVAAALNFGAWIFPTQWQDGIVFLLLILVLLVRPQGCLGKRLKSVEV